MYRNFLVLLVLAALTIAAGGMACGNKVRDIDTSDETDGAT
jgi:hypothetical protein